MENLYSEIRPGDVLPVEGNSRLSRIIQLMTKSSWSHAALSVGNRLAGSKSAYVQYNRQSAAAVDSQHMLVEADGANGVIAVPLSKYNIIRVGKFDYKSIWAER